MPEIDEKLIILQQELLDYLINQGFTVISAKRSGRFSVPLTLHNDGYGDQEDKIPDVLAYNEKEKHHIIGIARTCEEDLESEGSLTEYNVFLDQTQKKNGEPFRLYIIVPSSKIQTITSLITHYIHREYWFKVVFVSSTKLT